MRHLIRVLAVILATAPVLGRAHPVAPAGGESPAGALALLGHLLTSPDHAPLILLALGAGAFWLLQKRT